MHNLRPPRWAERWIESRLPPEIAEALLGDLHLLYLDRRETAGRTRADLWYWGQAFALRGRALRRSGRRLARVQPAHERARTGRAFQPSMMLPMSATDFRYALRRLMRTPGFTLAEPKNHGPEWTYPTCFPFESCCLV